MTIASVPWPVAIESPVAMIRIKSRTFLNCSKQDSPGRDLVAGLQFVGTVLRQATAGFDFGESARL